MTRKKSPTMADVAKRAGVSQMTVSRALRPNTPASKETRARILKAAEELGYVLDGTASGLSSRQSGFVAVTVPSLNNSNFAETVHGLSEGLKNTGLDLLLGYTNYDIDEEERVVKSLLRRRPEAIVVTGGNHTDRCRTYLGASGVPVIEIWDLPSNPIDHVVGFSNAHAAELMAEHFYDLGARKIGYIGGHRQTETRGAERRTGFQQALEALGLEATRVSDTGPPPTTINSGATALTYLLERFPDTEAVMCVSDIAAFGALMECARRGIDVPGKLMIGGFGADDIAKHCVPTLTTLDVGPYQIGVKASQIVQDALVGQTTLSRRIVSSPCRLMIGGSTVA